MGKQSDTRRCQMSSLTSSFSWQSGEAKNQADKPKASPAAGALDLSDMLGALRTQASQQQSASCNGRGGGVC